MKEGKKYNLTPKDIAKTMFWINAIPTFIALVVLSYGIYSLINKFDLKVLLLLIPIIIGITTEVVYFFQSKFDSYSGNKYLWLVLISVNIIFIILDLIYIIHIIKDDFQSPSIYTLILYPIGLLILSIKGMRLLKK